MNKATPGPCKEVTIGATPHGGTYMVAYYFDSKYAPVPKHKATRIIIHEYDEKNRSIFRDYISCGPNDEEEYAAMEAYELSEPDPKPAKRRENGGEHRRGEGRSRSRQERHAPSQAKGAEEFRAREPREEKKPHPRSQKPKEGEAHGREGRPQHRPRPEGQKAHPEKHAEGQRPEQKVSEGERPAPRRPRRRPHRKPKAPERPQE